MPENLRIFNITAHNVLSVRCLTFYLWTAWFWIFYLEIFYYINKLRKPCSFCLILFNKNLLTLLKVNGHIVEVKQFVYCTCRTTMSITISAWFKKVSFGTGTLTRTFHVWKKRYCWVLNIVSGENCWKELLMISYWSMFNTHLKPFRMIFQL